MSDPTTPVTAPADPPRRSRRPRWLAATVSAALLVAALLIAVRLAVASPAASLGAPLPQPTASGSTTAGVTTRDQLLAAVAHLTTSPGDGTAGRYEYLHWRRWMLATTGRPAARPMTTMVTSIDRRQWLADDGATTTIDISTGLDYTLAAANPAYRTNDTEFAGHRPEHHTYPANTMRPFTGTVPADRAALTTALAAVDPNAVGTKGLILAIDELFTVRYVDLSVRTAILRLLADRPDLTFRPQLRDRSGRTGFGLSIDDANLRYTLVFDPTTGELLASEQLLIAPATDFTAPAGLVYYSTLFLDRARRPAAS